MPFTTPTINGNDLRGLFKGAYHWQSQTWDNINAPTILADNMTNSQSGIAYGRTPWRYIEKTGQGVYDWSWFDSLYTQGANAGKKVGWRITTMGEGGAVVGGNTLEYPDYLHTQMQAEANKDWANGGRWIPNWNSESYLSAIEKLCLGLKVHLETTKLNGKTLLQYTAFIDISGYGDFGEWHSWPFGPSTPAYAKPTAASLNRIVAAFVNAFPTIPLIVPVNAFDPNQSYGLVPNATGYYILTTKNTWGNIGYRIDHLGDPALDSIIGANPLVVNGLNFGTELLNRYKTALVTGEPNNSSDSVTATNTQAAYFHLPGEIAKYGIFGFGNGNYWSVQASGKFVQGMFDNIAAASKAAGAKLQVLGGDVVGNQLTVNWNNAGNCPAYYPWNVTYLLTDAAGVVTKVPSGLNLRWATGSFSDIVTVPAGTYSLSVMLTDPDGIYPPLFLWNAGRAKDGSYPLGTITATSVTPVPPVVVPPVAKSASMTITDSNITVNGQKVAGPVNIKWDGTTWAITY